MYQQYPNIYYPQQPVFAIQPVYQPAYQPAYIPGLAPGAPGIPYPGAPGVNPQNPVEVEDPADNRPNEDLTNGNDEDTVAIDSA